VADEHEPEQSLYTSMLTGTVTCCVAIFGNAVVPSPTRTTKNCAPLAANGAPRGVYEGVCDAVPVVVGVGVLDEDAVTEALAVVEGDAVGEYKNHPREGVGVTVAVRLVLAVGVFDDVELAVDVELGVVDDVGGVGTGAIATPRNWSPLGGVRIGAPPLYHCPVATLNAYKAFVVLTRFVFTVAPVELRFVRPVTAYTMVRYCDTPTKLMPVTPPYVVAVHEPGEPSADVSLTRPDSAPTQMVLASAMSKSHQSSVVATTRGVGSVIATRALAASLM